MLSAFKFSSILQCSILQHKFCFEIKKEFCKTHFNNANLSISQLNGKQIPASQNFGCNKKNK